MVTLTSLLSSLPKNRLLLARSSPWVNLNRVQNGRFLHSSPYICQNQDPNDPVSAEKIEKFKMAAGGHTTPHFKNFIEDKGSSVDETKNSTSVEVITTAQDKNTQDYLLPHPIWSQDEVDNVKITHRKPVGFVDKAAYFTVFVLRKSFDLASGYTIGSHFKLLDERSVLTRCIFLETVAGVPGFSAAMIRHLHSLRRMQRDHGWIHTLLEEAENERMHLMTFLQLRRPGPFFRASVIISQWIFTGAFSFAYLVSPSFCHRFVGYLEEQAVITYSHILEELDAGRLPMWEKLPAPEIAVRYWQLPQDAMMRDVILAIRADEAHHRLVNHTLGSMKVKDSNPFKAGE